MVKLEASSIWNRFTRLRQVIAIWFLLVLFIPYCQVYHYYSETDAKWHYEFIWSDIYVLAFYLILFCFWYAGTAMRTKWKRTFGRIVFFILGGLILPWVWLLFNAFPKQDFIPTWGVFALPLLIVVILLDWLFIRQKNNLISSGEILDDLEEW